MTFNSRTVRVLFIPKWDDGNPYQRLLMDALKSVGIETTIRETLPIFTLLIYSLRDRDLDVIHVHWPDPLYIFKYGYSAPLYQRSLTKLMTMFKLVFLILDVELTRLLGAKIVWTVHDKYDHNKNHKNIQIIAGAYLTRRVNEIEVKCESAERTIRDLYRIPKSVSVNVIPHGNYIEEYENTVTKETARAELDIKKDSFVYLYFGSMRAYKGLPELIEAYSSLDGIEDSQLLVVGNERDEKPIQSALIKAEDVDNIVTVPEYISDIDVQLYFNATDVVVLPFRDILASGSTLLAMGFGCPLVVRKKGCIQDIVPTENFTYDSKIEGLRRAMMDAYEANNLNNISEQNLERAREFDWISIAQKTVDMYEASLD